MSHGYDIVMIASFGDRVIASRHTHGTDPFAAHAEAQRIQKEYDDGKRFIPLPDAKVKVQAFAVPVTEKHHKADTYRLLGH